MKLSEAKRIIKHGLEETYYISFDYFKENCCGKQWLPEVSEGPGFGTFNEAKFYAEQLAEKTKGTYADFLIFKQTGEVFSLVEEFELSNR